MCSVGARSGKPLSNMAMLELVRGMRGKGATVHGFRSTFRDWAAEQTSYPNELCEIALAHAVSDKTEAAYRRGDMMEKRRRLMADWAAYCGRGRRRRAAISCAFGRPRREQPRSERGACLGKAWTAVPQLNAWWTAGRPIASGWRRNAANPSHTSASPKKPLDGLAFWYRPKK